MDLIIKSRVKRSKDMDTDIAVKYLRIGPTRFRQNKS